MNQTTIITPEKLAELRAAIAALQADDIEYDYRSPWYVSNVLYVRSCRNSFVADADAPEVATYIAAADPQTVLGLLDEVERLRGDRDSWVESVWACLQASGAPSDIDNAEGALKVVGTKPSHFVKKQFDDLRTLNAKVTESRDNLLDEVARLRSQRDYLVSEYERGVGCGQQGYTHAAMHLFDAIVYPRCDRIADLTVEVERLRARIKELDGKV